MKNLPVLIISTHIAVFGTLLAINTTQAQVLRPGDDAVITPGGRTIVNPPTRTRPATPRPIRNPDGSTTYPRGTTPPRTDGFTQVNPDGSVTIFPRGGTRTPPPPRPTRQPPRLRPGDDAVITPVGRITVNPPLPKPRRTTQPPRLRPGDDAVITPGGRTLVNPPLPSPRRTTTPPRTTQSPRLRPGDDALITPGGRTLINPKPEPKTGGIPRPTIQPQPKPGSNTRIRRFDFGNMVTPDGHRFDPRSFGTGRVSVMPPTERRQ